MLEQMSRPAARAADLHCVVSEWSDDSLDASSVGRVKGVLSGMALAHKDIFDLPGRAPGLGVDHGQRDASRTRAAALERLVQAGASQWATLSMAPFACGATAQNPYFPRVINPIDPDLAVGGSSSGSAVAVQNFFQNSAILVSMGLYSVAAANGVGSIPTILALGGLVCVMTLIVALRLPKVPAQLSQR